MVGGARLMDMASQGGNGGNTGGRDRNAGYAGNGRQGGGGNTGNNGGGGGRRNRWRPRCQICKNWGHEADDYRKRYDQDHNFRSANSASTNTVDFPWVLDTGATDHLTNDLERLQVHERYDGKDQVQVANGAGLSISHIGHSRLPGSSLKLRNILHVPHIS